MSMTRSHERHSTASSKLLLSSPLHSTLVVTSFLTAPACFLLSFLIVFFFCFASSLYFCLFSILFAVSPVSPL